MSQINHGRRKFVQGSLAASVSTAPLLVAGCSTGSSVDRQLSFSTLTEGLQEAERLVSLNAQPVDSEFSLAQTLIHCAQSIEFSMDGFPQMKSSIFQHTVGSAAFRVFSWRQRMSHNLSEAIPGAQALSADATPEQALARLTASIEAFRATTDPLMPHFAYGNLSKEEYLLAHAMHLANHFSTVDA